MRSVTGQVKIWLQFQVPESTTYSRVRKWVLQHDVSTTRWSEQMVLGNGGGGRAADGPAPMEADRVENRPKGKNGSKGKSKDKGQGKGKQNGKQKGGKPDYKGKGRGGDQKGGKNNSGDRSKGKGKSDKQCHACSRYGHFA